MENIKVTHDKEKKKLHIEVDLSKEVGPSESGKTILIAKTGRSEQVAPGVFLGLNLYRYKDPKKES